jgi:hypothetical protein
MGFEVLTGCANEDSHLLGYLSSFILFDGNLRAFDAEFEVLTGSSEVFWDNTQAS